jgi:hypothetical protein
MRSPEMRARITTEESSRAAVNPMQEQVRLFGNMFEVDDPLDYEPTLDSSIAARAARGGVKPTELAYDLLVEHADRAALFLPFLNYADGNLDVVMELLSHRDVVPGLGDSHIDRDRHREHRSRRCTSQMRHFIELTFAPCLLSSGMTLRSPTCELVARAGSTARLPARHRRTLAGAKNISVIASAADAHRYAAAPAAIQPVALLPLLHRTPPQHWAAPGFAGLNACAEDRPHRHRTAGGPGGFERFPGLLCVGVGQQLRAERRSASRPRQS